MSSNPSYLAMRTRRLERGLCAQCGDAPHRPDHKTCEDCAYFNRMKYRERQGLDPSLPARHYALNTNRHQCVRCREPHAPGSMYCHDHERILAELRAEGEPQVNEEDGDE